MYRGCAYFVVLGRMIFKYTSFPPELPVVLVRPYVQTRSHIVPVSLSTNVAFSTDIIECAVMTCDHLAFVHCVFYSHSYCFEHFIENPHLHL